MKIIKIQPKEHSDLTLPYPYFIDEKGLVGRQDFWKGKPYRLIGFSIIPTPADSSLHKFLLRKFLEKPKIAIGKYPVFSDKKNNWFTLQDQIESISIDDRKK